ncbi:MAG: FecR domain-containing protein [Pseudomonadota bacterium]
MTTDPKDQAIHWHLRQRAGDMDEAEWDAFTSWLEEDERHAELLDQVAAADDAIGELAAVGASSPTGGENAITASNENDRASETPPEPANDNQLRRFLPFAGLVAAAVAVFALWPSAPAATLYSTDPGVTQIVAVSDEITMTLNGGTQVSVIEEETRVSIMQGEVIFAINSEEPSPLRVEVADLVLTDYGTVFNVVLDEEQVRVAVAEGIVGINPENENVEVAAGEQVTQLLGDTALVRSEVDPETVGAWQEGRLEFDNTPAPEAVAMLERSIGSKVTLAEALEDETLTGSLIVSDDEHETVTQFAAFLGAQARRGRLAGYGMVWDVR